MKTLLKFLALLIVIAGILFAFLPQIASTKWGSPYVIRLINRDFPGTITVENLTLSWKGPQSAESLRWQNDQVDLSVPKVTSTANLFSLIFCCHLADTKVTDPELSLSGETLKTVRLKQAGFIPLFSFGCWTGTIDITNGLIQYLEESLSDLDARIELSKDDIATEFKGMLGPEQIESKAHLSLKEGAFSSQGMTTTQKKGTAFWEMGGKFQNGKIIEWRSGGKNLSSSLLELAYLLLRKEELPLGGILGNRADFVFNFEENGPVEGGLIAPMGEAKFSGKMVEGVLHLDTPLEAQLILSHALSRLLFPPNNPSGIQEIYSDQPVKLAIAPKESAIPLLHWAPRDLSLNAGRIELSEVTCHMPGGVGALFKFLDAENKSASPIKLWFGPLDFAAKDGWIEIERTDFLMDKTFHLCFWGSYNLVKEKLNLTLGITAPTLQRILKIDGLPEDYVLQLPVSFKNQQLKIDFKKAAEKLAKIMLWYKACEEGLLFFPFPEEKRPAPPPNLPLPWDLVLQ